MKKRYEKPQIVFEDFTLSTNIAGTCENVVDGPSLGQCAMEGTGGIFVFVTGVQACEYTPTDMGYVNDDMYDGICYHVPIETNNLFNS